MSDSSKPPNADWHVSQADHFKALFEYLKHLSTLATGSILLIATLLEKLFKQPLYSWCIGVSVGAFFLSLLASLAAYSVFILNFPRVDRAFDKSAIGTTEMGMMVGGLVTTWISFLVGVGALAFFFLANWYHQP
jgi:hypothetical protein